MTELSAEILAHWQVRKTRAQKTAFIEFLQDRIPGLRVEEGSCPKCRNLILGDVDHAKVVFTAHYDTCARLPFPNFITPKNMAVYLLYNIVIALPFLAIMAALEWLFWIQLDLRYGPLLAMLVAFGLMFYVFLGGRPNPHTANDNTSGVITLAELAQTLSEEQLQETAFVFFDHEESGLFGSSWFASKHRKAMREKLLVNFDCVSDGDNILFVLSRRAKKRYAECFREAFPTTAEKQVYVESSTSALYPSDQINFRYGAGVAALNRKRGLGLYLSRIHTPKDTVFQEENIAFLVEGTKRLIHKI